MGNRVYLHIGPHKTGTTYIQKNLYLHKNTLATLGYLYPEPREVVEKYDVYAHQELHDSPEEIINLILQNEKSSLNLIISFEGLSLYDKEKISQLRDYLNQYGYKDARIIFFVRNPAERLYSLYQELVKHGETDSFLKFLINQISSPFLKETMNYCLIIDRWAEIFGYDNIYLIDYDSFIDFMRCLGIDDSALSKINHYKVKINPSMVYPLPELIRALNILAKNQGVLNKNNITLQYLELRKQHSEFKNLQEEFIRKIQEYYFKVRIGEFLLDNLGNLLLKKYLKNFFNKPTKWKSVVLDVADDQWVFDTYLSGILRKFFETILSNMRSDYDN